VRKELTQIWFQICYQDIKFLVMSCGAECFSFSFIFRETTAEWMKLMKDTIWHKIYDQWATEERSKSIYNKNGSELWGKYTIKQRRNKLDNTITSSLTNLTNEATTVPKEINQNNIWLNTKLLVIKCIFTIFKLSRMWLTDMLRV
jgi:hypothetical protein